MLERDIEYAKKHNMHIFVYGVASLKGGVMKSASTLLTNVHHQVVVTRLNTKIQKLCTATKGSFFTMSTSSKDIYALIRAIKKRYSSGAGISQTSQIQELYYIPLSIAAVLFLLFFIGERR